MSLTGISPPATPPPADQSFDDKWIELKRHEAARQDMLAVRYNRRRDAIRCLLFMLTHAT
jgi:hypothetical protein